MTHQPFAFQDVPGPRRDMVGYGRHAPRARWPDNARVAINLVINYEEGLGILTIPPATAATMG